jgi:hypothetical protein
MYRAIGNDVPPRHAVGQSYTNVKFILDNEPELEGLTRAWVVNRILNITEETRLLDLLDDYNQYFIHNPVDLKEYAAAPFMHENFRLDEGDKITPDVIHRCVIPFLIFI